MLTTWAAWGLVALWLSALCGVEIGCGSGTASLFSFDSHHRALV